MLQQLPQAEGLAQDGVCAGIPRHCEVIGLLPALPAGDDHDMHAGFPGAEILHRLEPVPLGHEEVRDQHVGGSFLVHLHGTLAVRNRFHLVTFALQRNAERGPHVIVVVARMRVMGKRFLENAYVVFARNEAFDLDQNAASLGGRVSRLS